MQLPWQIMGGEDLVDLFRILSYKIIRKRFIFSLNPIDLEENVVMTSTNAKSNCEKKLKIFNEFNGIGDQSGKQYLVDFTNAGYEGVIPSVDKMSDISKLGIVDRYCIKPKDGADSNGLKFLAPEELQKTRIPDGEYVIQPWIDFDYEVSFYFINDKFEYAMYAPDKNKRWQLELYPCSPEDLDYAKNILNLSPVIKEMLENKKGLK